MIWIDEQNRLIGNYRLPHPNGKLLALGAKDEAYMCGATGAKVFCVSISPGAENATWTIDLTSRSLVNGGVIVPGRMYINLDKDSLYAFGTNETGAP
jgi:hypothetical protein